jgi:plasmid stability protein
MVSEGYTMATITVKNIPDDVYRRLKAAAESNRRSINGEIISRIEQSLRSRRVTANEILARVRLLQAGYGERALSIGEIDAARREGRP